MSQSAAELRREFEQRLATRSSHLNEPTAAKLNAKTLEEHASTPLSGSSNGYADAHNYVVFAAQRLLAAEKREAICELANRYPAWDQHANEMRNMLLKLAGDL